MIYDQEKMLEILVARNIIEPRRKGYYYYLPGSASRWNITVYAIDLEFWFPCEVTVHFLRSETQEETMFNFIDLADSTPDRCSIFNTPEERDKAWEEFKESKRPVLRRIFREWIMKDYEKEPEYAGWECLLSPDQVVIFPRTIIKGNCNPKAKFFLSKSECLEGFESELLELIKNIGGI